MVQVSKNLILVCFCSLYM